MAKGIVYILTNPCLDGWIKIGMTEKDNIESRLTELNSPTNIPLSYRAYALYEVENPKSVESSVHKIIDLVDEELHARETLASGKIRQREFFRISPEKAYAVFKEIATLRGDIQNLKLVKPNAEQIEEEEISEQAKPKRTKLTFEMLNIDKGSELRFLYDDSRICVTADNTNQVIYEGQTYSLSGLASALLVSVHNWKEGASVQGGKYFTYNGQVLTDLRDSLDKVTVGV
jgi:hypothetical protein